MTKSKRACCVVFTATMLALASHAGAVGQATTPTGVAIDGGPATSTARRAARKAAKAQSAVAATPEIDTSMAPETTGGEPAEGKLKGKVVGSSGIGGQDALADGIDPACATKTDASRPASCPKGINQAGASAVELDRAAAPATTDRVGHGGTITGSVVINNGNSKQVREREAIDAACTPKSIEGKPASCPKAINKPGIK